MSSEIAEALREQTRRLMAISERFAIAEAKQELAAVASALAQLAELLERKRRR